MNFKKELKVNKYLLKIDLNNLFLKKKNLFFFGTPYGIDFSKVDEENIESKVKEISGNFFIIVIKKNKITFITDPISNFRAYYKFHKNKLIVFNDLKKLNDFKLSLDKNIFNFFINKNYTPGNITFFKNIYKFQPCTIYHYTGKLDKKIYFEKFINSPNRSRLNKLLSNYLDNEINKIKNLNKKMILLFSGGKDSCLLFQNLIKKNVNFTPVYLHTNPESNETLKNLKLATDYCKKYKKKLKIICIDIRNEVPNKFRKNYLLFDHHISLLHFYGVKLIKKIYGKKIILISGQSCDSILSFGPSQYTVSNFIARILIHLPFSIFSKFLIKLINLKFKKKIFIIKNFKEYYRYFYYSFFYYVIGYENNSKFPYDKKVFNFTHSKNKKISNLMYLKCHGFLQGPDNLILIKVAEFFKINYVVMPYTSYNFIKIICQNYNFKLDILFPKYIIDDLLKSYFIIKVKNFIYKKKSKVKLSDLDTKIKKDHINRILHEIR
tara:strand:+ start:402 stop:1880 length:1479 start_codon:yes stop_codon:yes gene_type:complete